MSMKPVPASSTRRLLIIIDYRFAGFFLKHNVPALDSSFSCFHFFVIYLFYFFVFRNDSEVKFFLVFRNQIFVERNGIVSIVVRTAGRQITDRLLLLVDK